MTRGTRALLRRTLPATSAAGALMLLAAGAATAQHLVPGYTYTEVNPARHEALIFGVASFKLCQIKTFFFQAVYILSALAFVAFAIKALFTKFEPKVFLQILGAIFVVASADLFIAFMSNDAFYCPTALSAF